MQNRYSRKWLLLLCVVTGCTLIAERRMEKLYGVEEVRDRIRPISEIAPEDLANWYGVKRVLESRCIVCHSCYDAPCQTKLTSPAGIDRGNSKDLVYNTERLAAADPTRLGIDASNAAGWRKKGFSSILNERHQSPEANLQSSVLYRLLELKNRNPMDGMQLNRPISEGDLDFSLDRAQTCPSSAEISAYEQDHPEWGMPFGLPAISEDDFATIKQWLTRGAIMPKPKPLSRDLAEAVSRWEHFLNGNSPKEQLMSRYLYEHLFLGDMLFNELDQSRTFKLVRSRTGPGEPISIIATRRPTDDPGVAPFFYRLLPEEESEVAKTRMIYRLNASRMDRFTKLFLSPSYAVTRLPSYDREISSNPFKAFQELPLRSRYQFLLDDAHYFVMGFIKGPVCRGQTALNVIDDRFWVFFVQPELFATAEDEEFLVKESDKLSLPSEAGSTASFVFNWQRYAQQEKELLAARRRYLGERVAQGFKPTLELLWNGEGKNSNAALTVFRHYDSATVVQGLIGDAPKTAWVMNYSMVERIHYLLVAEYDVYGNFGHQLLTRLYMDFLRVEGENNFLILLPSNIREIVHNSWYRGIGSTRNEYTLSSENFDWAESAVTYVSADPEKELFGKLRRYFGKVLSHQYELGKDVYPEIRSLGEIKGIAASLLPEVSVLRLDDGSENGRLFSIIANRSLGNVAVLYLEQFRRVPEEDTLTITPGILGAHPNAFFELQRSDLQEFVSAVSQLRTESDYANLLDRFGVRRTAPHFWQFSDRVQEFQRRTHDTDAGILDYSRFENR